MFSDISSVGIICKVGDSCTGVVLLVDAQCAQLTLSKEVVKAVQNFKDNKFSKVQYYKISNPENEYSNFFVIFFKNDSMLENKFRLKFNST